jgi:hypothetical protein
MMYLTNHTKQSAFEIATKSSASQEIPHILWNPEIHCCIHKSATFCYSEADQSSPSLSIPPLKDQF